MTRNTCPAPLVLAATAALAGALALAGCSGGSDAPQSDANMTEAPIVENMGFENMVEPIAPSNASAAPTPAAADSNATAEDVAPEQQVQDDADASGMTARVSREDAATAANEASAAGVSERK